jgi:hypothetical protein
MTLEIKATDSSFDLVDAVAYEFFMDNLPVIIGDCLNNPEITDEEIEQIIKAITLLAEMSYKIAERFELVRIKNKTTNDRIESD